MEVSVGEFVEFHSCVMSAHALLRSLHLHRGAAGKERIKLGAFYFVVLWHAVCGCRSVLAILYWLWKEDMISLLCGIWAC